MSHELDLDDHPSAAPTLAYGRATPGKRSMTQGLAPRPMLHRRATRDDRGVADDAEAAVDRAAGTSGAPLPPHVQRQFEGSLGADLSGVRVHTGADSAEAAHAVGAKAYTVGHDIHFAAGHYQPDDPFGLHLLAHEVAHTVQQRGAAPHRQHKLDVSAPHDPAELEADRAADAMVRGAPMAVGGGRADSLMRQADLDTRMSDGASTTGLSAGNDAQVRLIASHTTVSDQGEARRVLAQIQGAQSNVVRLSKEDDRYDYLQDNATAAFALSEYLTSVTDVGDTHGQFASAYQGAKRDHGEFVGAWATFHANDHKLGANSLERSVDAMVRRDPAFAAVLGDFKKTRTELATDTESIKKHRDDAQTAKFELSSKLHEIRAKAASARADKKQAELAKVLASIDEMTSTIMTVGKMAMSAVTGMIAMTDGAGGIDFEKLVEHSHEITPAAPTASPPTTPSLAAPDISKFTAPGTDLNPHGVAAPEDGLGKPGDTRAYTLPSTTIESLKGLGAKGIDLAGGPEKLIKSAITQLEKADIQGLKAQIQQAKEEQRLEEAAAMAVGLEAAKNKYKSAILQVQSLIDAMTKHKANLSQTTDRMKRLANAAGDKSDTVPALRLVTLADRFVAQAELAINVGGSEIAEGNRAIAQRGKIDGNFTRAAGSGEAQKRFWTARQLETGTLWKTKVWQASEHRIELTSAGKDSVFGMDDHGNVAAVTDTKAATKQLEAMKADVIQKRTVAQRALGLEDAAASTKAG